MDLEAQTLSGLKYFKLYRSILVSGADFIKIMDLFAREGSIFDDVVAENIDWEIMKNVKSIDIFE